MKKIILPLTLSIVSTFSLAGIRQDSDPIFKDLVMKSRMSQKIEINDFKKYACDGYPYAQKVVGSISLKNGDNYKGAFWLLESAKRGDADSMYAISTMYLEGRNIHRDSEEGYKWFSLYSKDNVSIQSKTSLYSVGNVTWTRKKFEEVLTTQQMTKIEQLTKNWLPLNDAPIKDCDETVEKYEKTLKEYFVNKAKEYKQPSIAIVTKQDKEDNLKNQNTLSSKEQLSIIYYEKVKNKTITEKEKTQLLVMLNELTTVNSREGMNLLAKIYREGILTPKNIMQSLIIYEKLILDKTYFSKQYLDSFVYSLKPEDVSPQELDKIMQLYKNSNNDSIKVQLSNGVLSKEPAKIIELLKEIKNPSHEAKLKLADTYLKEGPNKDLKKVLEVYDGIYNSTTDEKVKARFVLPLYEKPELLEYAQERAEELSNKGFVQAKIILLRIYYKKNMDYLAINKFSKNNLPNDPKVKILIDEVIDKGDISEKSQMLSMARMMKLLSEEEIKVKEEKIVLAKQAEDKKRNEYSQKRSEEYKEKIETELKDFEAKALAGDEMAKHELVHRYMQEKNFYTNYPRALFWSRKIVQEAKDRQSLRHIAVLSRLLLMKENSNPPSQNYVEAYKWLYIAENKLDNNSSREVRKALESEMSRGDINKGIKLANEWIPPTPQPGQITNWVGKPRP